MSSCPSGGTHLSVPVHMEDATKLAQVLRQLQLKKVSLLFSAQLLDGCTVFSSRAKMDSRGAVPSSHEKVLVKMNAPSAMWYGSRRVLNFRSRFRSRG
jgi:hypothetical protein